MLVLLSAEKLLKALSEASIRPAGHSKSQLRVLSDLFKESPFCIFPIPQEHEIEITDSGKLLIFIVIPPLIFPLQSALSNALEVM